MSNHLRRAQLISTAGVGAITVMKGGTVVVTAALDHWFEGATDQSEFQVDEPRLSTALGNRALFLPPDSRRPVKGTTTPNASLTIPVLRFPEWHVCGDCGEMRRVPSYVKEAQFCQGKCSQAAKGSRRRRIFQVRFVAACEDGHLQDFPWREWTHRSVAPQCNAKLKLEGGASASLAALFVSCECGVRRSLAGILTGDENGTELTRELASDGTHYLCPGVSAWAGTTSPGCKEHLRGSLQNATNLYFPDVESALHLPANQLPRVPHELTDFLAEPRVATVVSALRQMDALSIDVMRKRFSVNLQQFTDEQLSFALGLDALASDVPPANPLSAADIRREEYAVLRESQDRQLLKVDKTAASEYRELWPGVPFSRFFDDVSLVRKLRETRAFCGFSRFRPQSVNLSRDEKIRSLWRRHPGPGMEWLPAFVVHGEGIFLRLNLAALAEWEDPRRNPQVAARIARLAAAHQRVVARGWGQPINIDAGIVLLHTLAHVLINRLSFECGYSSASLRERIYWSKAGAEPLAGVLIYTASGDADGTLGGLVRMGEPGKLESVLARAVDSASWCSADPVCMEIGSTSGQGPDSLNSAACHSCALVSETSCEHFNRYLDRALLGVLGHEEIGYFTRETHSARRAAGA